MKDLKSNIVQLSFIILISLASCTTTRVAKLTRSENEKLEVYTTELPSKNYVEIGYIQSDGSIFHTPQQLLNGIKNTALELNADAVINIKYDFQGWYPIASGTAIKYEN